MFTWSVSSLRLQGVSGNQLILGVDNIVAQVLYSKHLWRSLTLIKRYRLLQIKLVLLSVDSVSPGSLRSIFTYTPG